MSTEHDTPTTHITPEILKMVYEHSESSEHAESMIRALHPPAPQCNRPHGVDWEGVIGWLCAAAIPITYLLTR